MVSTFEFGPLIIEAAATGDHKKLREIRRKVDNDKEFRKLCDEYSDFSTGRSVLHLAAQIGHFEICRFLIKSVKVYINVATYRRDTPLIEATKGEHIKIVKYLIDQGAKISMVNLKGFSALHYALFKDNMELMELLLTKGALIEADSVEGTPLQCAASRGNVEAVKLLLSRGAKACNCYVVVETPLVCAIKARSFECMDLLLKANANPKNYFAGLSPLCIAAKDSDTRFIVSLLEAGARPDLHISDPLRAIEEAAMAHNREGVEMLLPLTEPLKHYQNWSVDGIMDCFHSEEAKTMREKKWSERMDDLGRAGEIEVSLKKYKRALLHYRMASLFDPSNPEWISMQSLCYAHAGMEPHALFEAEKCIRFEPRFPAPHQGGDAATEIFKKFLMRGLAFVLDPDDEDTEDAFRVAMFHYFAWLYEMSSPDEILSFTDDCYNIFG